MGPFWALLKNSFLSLLLTTAGGRKKRNNRKAVSGLGALALICIILLYISGTYSFALASALGPVGGLDIMLGVMTMMAVLLPLVFTLYSAQGTIFATKDMDLVLSLPVSTLTVMLSRVMALYLELLLMLEMIMIPAGVAYLMNGGGGGAALIIMLLLENVFLAFIPTLITMVFGYLIGFLVSRLRFKNLFSIIFSIAVIAIVFVLAFSFGNGMETMVNDIEGVRDTLFGALPPLKWAVLGMTELRLRYLLLIILICTVPFFLVAWLFSLNYKRLLTNLTGHRVRNDFRLGEVGASGNLSALLKKEARRFFGTPMYFLNSGVGCILLLIALVALLVKRDSIQAILNLLATDFFSVQMVQTYLPGVFLALLFFFIITVAPSAVSISLEGKSFWILKEAPLGTGRIFLAKAGFNFILGGSMAVLASIIGGIAIGLEPLGILCILILSLLCAAYVAMLGLMINLSMPRLDAENETIVIKQSGSVLVNMLLGTAMLAVMLVLFLVLTAVGLSFPAFSLVMALILLAVDFLLFRLLNTKGRRLFAELY